MVVAAISAGFKLLVVNVEIRRHAEKITLQTSLRASRSAASDESNG